MMLSQGQEWIQFAGIVRLADIDSDNTGSPRPRVADAKIEYAGKGPVSRASREGWLSKFFNMISPF
jgi:flagellar L-ring protein precursor FlgH